MKFANIKRFTLLLMLVLSHLIVASVNVNFYNINEMYGITMREGNSVVKDDNGFIWASSKTGILRLTEDDYRIYQLPYASANILTVRLVYDSPVLSAFTNNGQIFQYNKVYDRFDLLVNLSAELHSNFLSVHSIVSDGETNDYWFSTTSGLYKYSNGQLVQVNTNIRVITNIIKFDKQKIVLSSYEGLSFMDTETLESEMFFKYNFSPLPEVSKFFIDSKRNLWIGTMSGILYHYNFDTKDFGTVDIFPKQPILAISEISDSTMMVGIDGQGLWEINSKTYKQLNVYKENIDNPASLRGNGVYDMYCDPGKRVWISTYSGGISYFDLISPIVTQISHYANNPNSLISNDVNCVIEDKSGNMWFATNNGISCWEVSSNKWRNYYVNKQEQAQVFLTLCEDDKGRIWAGTYSSGVYVLDAKTGRQISHYSPSETESPFSMDFVFDIFKDSGGDLWIGGINSRVVRYQSKDDTFRKYSLQPVNVLGELNKGQMLFGCTYGLTLTNKDSGEGQTIVDGFVVQDILVDNGVVWLATSGDGLIRFDAISRISEKYTIDNGLPSNFVNSITEANGYLWLGTENGLCRFDPSEKSALVYSSIHALSNLSFNRNSDCNLSNGQLAFGTNKGVVIFNPKTIKQEHSEGKIFLQDISIMGRSIRDLKDFDLKKPLDQLDKITVKYNQNNIAFELLPIGVASGSKFSWMLEGLDEDWVLPASHRILSYTNIPSKEYKLKIRLYDNSLSTIVAERSFVIKVTPPFWATSWFLIVIFLLVTSVIYFSFWYYISMLKQRHTEEKVRFFTNTAHDLRTSLTLIKAPIEELNKETNLSTTGRNFINLAHEQALRLSSVVTQLMDFQKVDVGKGQMSFSMVNVVEFVANRIQMFESLAAKRDVKIHFNCNKAEYLTAIDESMIEKVIDNLISNAVKYSFVNTTIEIEMLCSDSEWALSVKDKGIGISKKAQRQLFKEFYRGENAINSKIVGSGIGLLLVKNYVNMHDGEVIFTSEENQGSTFQINIPKKAVENTAGQGNASTESEMAKIKLTSEPDSSANDDLQDTSKEMKILIVEDNDDLLYFMRDSLRDDFEVHIANDGEKAWEVIQTQLPDLVVTDVMMPNKDGFELCQLVKSTFETSHIAVVLLTALSGKAEQIHGLGLGADDYLTKPFDMALLRQKIKSIIQNRENVRRKALRLNKASESEPVLNNDFNDQFVKKMLEVVRENISNTSFNKEEFASAMNVSSSLLYKKVKSLTDQSPTDFIKSVRMDYALELLQSRQHNVTEVSEMCGFSSIGYFSTVFKKHFGKSPTEV